MLIYLIVVNILSLLFFGLDKYKAVNNQFRIPEKTLLTLTFLGGFLGAVFGMVIFRHKTSKTSFQIKFWLIVFVWVFIALYILFNYY